MLTSSHKAEPIELSAKSIDLVPKMTSNTTPSGEAIASGEHPGYDAYKAFDKELGSSKWVDSTSALPKYIGYIFPNKTKVGRVVIVNELSTPTQGIKQCKVEALNDSNVWIQLTAYIVEMGQGETKEITIENPDYYQAYRVRVISGYSSFVGIAELYLYDR